MTLVVPDTGPLIHLAEIESLSLFSIADRCIVPKAVHEELRAGELPAGLDELGYELETAEVQKDDYGDLDRGETAALALANEHDATLLTDDLAAREAAEDAGIEVHGSIGVIALGYGRGVLDRDEAAHRMRALQRETSLFVTDAVVERGIDLLNDA